MKKIVLFLLLILTSISFAQQESYVHVLEGEDVYEGGTYILTDAKISQIGQGYFSTESTLDYVELGFAEGISNTFVNSYDLEVDISITGIDENNNQTNIGSESLHIEYLNSATNVDTKIDAITFDGYPKIKVVVTEIRYDDGSTVENFMPENTYLKLGIDQERYYHLEVNDVPGTSSHILNHRLTDEDNSSVDDHIEFYWEYIEGAVYYELEWAYVEAFNNDATGLKDELDVDFSKSDFRWNSTRIQTTEQNYKIPLVFEQGYLVYRLRPVGYIGGGNQDLHLGKWSTEIVASQNTNLSNFPHVQKISATLAHESLLNWQYTATFAENGKRKEVISYYDGSLRNRQTVTLLNTTDEAVVGQQIYDGIGRKAIDVLPTPAGENIIKYYEDYNVNTNGTTNAYSYTDFDMTDQSNLGSCVQINIEAMNSSSGAQKYYSSNADQRTKAHDYIPKANGFPFVQTVYTPDNTGRVRQQSGVGADFLTTGDHATRYFYSQPSQEELDRLFGANVGYKKHYQKNMVVDANGQVSVSYKDPQGRVIATALAGVSPENLEALKDESGNPLDEGGQMTIDLLSKVDISGDGTTTDEVDNELDDNYTASTNNYNVNDQLVFTSEEPVIQNNAEYTFEYNATSPGFTDDCLDNGQSQTYYPYIYDLDISVVDDCSETPVFLEQGVVAPQDANIPNDYFGTVPSIYNMPNMTNPLMLDIGTYTINKTLTVNEEAIEYFAQQYIADGQANGCINTLNIFENEELAQMETDGCNVSCDECLNDLGTKTDFITQMFAQYNITVSLDGNGDVVAPVGEEDRLEEFENMYNTEQDLCNRLCETSYSLCEGMYFQMKRDVSPDQQYGATTGDMSLSVFSTSNDLVTSDINWQNPSTPYVDENGSPAKILLNQDPNTPGQYIPEVVSTGLVDISPSGIYTVPENLANLEDFLAEWSNEWAESLVAAHPEYCYYDWCTGISSNQYGYTTDDLTSEDVDNVLQRINTFSDASTSVELGTSVDLLDFNDLISVDPYFSGNTDLVNALTNYYDLGTGSYLDVLEFSVFMKTEGFIPGTTPNSATQYDITTYPGGLTSTQQDEIWMMYRSLILSEKQKLLKKLASEYAMENGCYNGCIGATDEEQDVTFQPLEDAFWAVSGILPIDVTTYYNSNNTPPDNEEPCDFTNYGNYGDKTQIWFAGTDAVNNQGGSDENLENLTQNTYNQIYDASGQCPLAFDLQGLFNSIISDDALSSDQLTATGVDLALKPYVSYNLQDALGMLGSSFPSTPPSGFYYDASVDISNPSILSIYLGESTNTCLTELELPNYSFANNNLNWDDYLDTWSIQNLGLLTFTNESNGVYEFTVQAWVNDLNDPTSAFETVVIKGTTCLMIGQCEVATNPSAENQPGELIEVCELNKNGKGLLDLIIQLHSTTPEGLDPSTMPVDLSSSNFENNALLSQYGSNWDLTSFDGSSYELTSALGDFLDVNINWGTHYPFNPSITEIQGITVYNDQTFSLHINTGVPGTWDPSTSYTVTGYVTENDSYITIGSCDECSTDDVSFTETFRSHVVEYLEGNPGVQPQFNNYFNEEYIDIVNENFSDGKLTYQLEESTRHEILCDIEVASSPKIDLSSANFATYDMNVNAVAGSPTIFTFEAMLVDGTWITLTVTSCIEVETCPCTPDIPQPTSCEEDYETYYEKLNTYPVIYSNNVISYTDFCEGNYRSFLLNYLSYLESLNSIYSTMPYVSIDDYMSCQQDEWMQFSMTDAHEDYNATLGTQQLLTVPYSEFEIVGDCDYCLDLYEEYLTQNVATLTQFDRLSMMEICGEPQVCPSGITNGNPNLVEDEDIPPYSCEDYLNDIAMENAQGEYNAYINSLIEEFKAKYINRAISDVVENFSMTRTDNEYQYTLFYYDQAGNLVRTVPPKGVDRMDESALDWTSTNNSIKAARYDYDPTIGYSSSVVPAHNMVTTYAYNALNQLVWQETPDGGESQFWYDALGRLVASQNAKQAVDHDFSYTRFDELGRTVEVGALEGNSSDVVAGVLQPDVNDANYPNNWSMTRYEVTKTIYDENIELPSTNPLYFRNRIGSVIQQEELDTDNDIYRSAYHYEYDVHGNVKWMQQDFRTNVAIDGSGLSATTEYEYDLISGNVLEVKYQTPSEKDLMIHRYFYDADNRIVDVETSNDGYFWNNDAHYIYYDHGPLARVELGNDKVQGIDYAYTIQGWIKGVNASKLDPNLDMGKDGYTTTSHVDKYSGRDVFGFALTYYDGDYEQIKENTWSPNLLGDLETARPVLGNGLFNGNIAQMSTAMMDENENIIPLISNDYTYDQLQRIKSMTSYESGTTVGTDYDYASVTGGNYFADYYYDANGNLKGLNRVGSGVIIDKLNYTYVNGGIDNNQLEYVEDDIGASVANDLASQSAGNYAYDEIGQLITDNQEEITNISWTTSGKVKYIERQSTSTKSDISFKYDPMGNRVLKMEIPRTGSTKQDGGLWNRTVYMRDAQGNVMATYDMDLSSPSSGYIQEKYYLSEQNIYGSSRVGMIKSNEYMAEREFEGSFSFEGMGFSEDQSSTVETNYDVDVIPFSIGESYSDHRGDRYYELSNHLGNVLVVITDRKIPEPNDMGEVAYYFADVVSYSDYYPGGMIMPGRNGSTSEYSYGFQGQLKDDEIKGEGNSINYKLRMYDPRIVRFFATDPYEASYPAHSTYSFVGNNPISNIEIDGGWYIRIFGRNSSTPSYQIVVTNVEKIQEIDRLTRIPVLGIIPTIPKAFAAGKDPSLELSATDWLNFISFSVGNFISLAASEALTMAQEAILLSKDILISEMVGFIASPEYRRLNVEKKAIQNLDGKEVIWNGKAFDLGSYSTSQENYEVPWDLKFSFNQELVLGIKNFYYRLEKAKLLENGKNYDDLSQDQKTALDERIEHKVQSRLEQYYKDEVKNVEDSYIQAGKELEELEKK